MSEDDIQFGEVEEIRPRSAVRPDHDAHFAVCEVGTINGNTLPIFVDLDALRDMEAHSVTNTDVELGGVMLGGQYEDSDGKPFVIVNDSLRAEHYEATKGSFKFTHETWTAISRQRDEYAPGTEMVGWYHTHPDWGVFLSGMDLFICENFFKRPLDVALVIDPCRQDRGWFHWTSVAHQKIDPTGGFYLYTNRYREDELEYFARLYHGPSNPLKNESEYSDQIKLFQGIPGMADPRYSPMGAAASNPIVNLVDQRQPPNHTLWAALMAMALVILYLGFQLFVASKDKEKKDQLTEQIESIQETLKENQSQSDAATTNQAYKELMGYILTQQPGGQELVNKLAEQEASILNHESNLAAQQAHNRELQTNLAATTKALEVANKKAENSKKDFVALDKKYKDLIKEHEKDGKTEKTTNWTLIASLIGGGLVLLFGGATGGYLYARKQFEDDFDHRPSKPATPMADLATREELESQSDDNDSINFS